MYLLLNSRGKIIVIKIRKLNGRKKYIEVAHVDCLKKDGYFNILVKIRPLF